MCISTLCSAPFASTRHQTGGQPITCTVLSCVEALLGDLLCALLDQSRRWSHECSPGGGGWLNPRVRGIVVPASFRLARREAVAVIARETHSPRPPPPR